MLLYLFCTRSSYCSFIYSPGFIHEFVPLFTRLKIAFAHAFSGLDRHDGHAAVYRGLWRVEDA